MKVFLSRLLLVLILPTIDFYVFKRLIKIYPNLFNKRKFKIIYWAISFSLVGFLLFFSLIENYKFREFLWSIFTTVVVFILLVFIPKIIAGIVFIFRDLASLFVSKSIIKKINRISLIIILVLGVIVELLIYKGVFYGRFNFKTPEYIIEFNDLPKSFDNYRIVHLSDLHLGSFKYHKSQVKKIVEISNSLKPDLIVFTGDLVNNTSDEAWVFFDILKDLRAKDGIIAVTGNHDYGTYVNWPNEYMKDDNFEQLILFYDSIGAKLLLNENIKINRNDEYIYIAGIESSGKPPFEELGDINKALQNTKNDDFIILLSHDPSYWKAEIVKHPQINLTLSGHTHSMQFGIKSDFLNIKWSPSKYIYPEWHGLYEYNNQILIVNNGAGYIAMPLRVGANPEIGLIILTCIMH